MTKRELFYDDIVHMREVDGLTWREIGERTGLSLKSACAYYHDPDGERALARKLKNARKCLGCGRTVNTDGRTTNPKVRCISCAAKLAGAERKVWTKDTIVVAIQEWAERFGEPPTHIGWDPSHAETLGSRAHDAYLNERGYWPHAQTVMREFGQPGGWAKALRAAGFEPRKRGDTNIARAAVDARRETLELLGQGMNRNQIARHMGVSWTTVSNRLERAAA